MEWITEYKVFASLSLVVIVLVLRGLISRRLRIYSPKEEVMPRRWANTAKNTLNFLLVIALILIWLSELRFVALSIATFVVALVIASREFIQCLLGALYQASTRTFTVGDWIKVGDYCGEVVSNDWLNTSLLEVDLAGSSYAYTGRSLYLPNNQFLLHGVVNLNFMRRYVAHSFTLVRDSDQLNLCDAKEYILAKAREYCAPFDTVAQRYNKHLEFRMGATLLGPEPSVRISTNHLAKNELTVSLFCPTDEAVDIEQKLVADFMTYWYQQTAQRNSQTQKTEEV